MSIKYPEAMPELKYVPETSNSVAEHPSKKITPMEIPCLNSKGQDEIDAMTDNEFLLWLYKIQISIEPAPSMRLGAKIRLLEIPEDDDIIDDPRISQAVSRVFDR